MMSPYIQKSKDNLAAADCLVGGDWYGKCNCGHRDFCAAGAGDWVYLPERRLAGRLRRQLRILPPALQRNPRRQAG